MTPDPPSRETALSPQGTDPHPEGGSVPLYRRSLFRLILGMLTGLAALFFVARGCQPSRLPDAGDEKEKDAGLRELIELQRAHNKGLEEEIRRLRGLMEEDPCSLSGLLGPSPENSPVAPGYKRPAEPGFEAPPAAPAPQSAPAPATVGDLLVSATVFILASNQEQVGMGSGFLVAPGVIATNSHVVLGPDSEIHVGNKALGGMHEARVIAYSARESRDYALLRIANELAGKVPVLRLGSGAVRTERVSAWGFPGYITEIDPNLAALAKGDAKAVPEVVYSEGAVSVVLDRKPPIILHTAAISQGNSGGPLVNAEGVVVGINTFIKIADKSYSQANIALEAGDLALFMKEHGIAPAESSSKTVRPQTPQAAGQEKREGETPPSGKDASPAAGRANGSPSPADRRDEPGKQHTSP